MFRKTKQGLIDGIVARDEGFAHDWARKVLERVFFDHAAEDLQTLIGFYSKHQHLFRTQGTHVVDGYVEYIGSGDSSVLRYIGSFLRPKEHTTEEACALAAYIISVANRHIDGCSGGPDLAILHSDGRVVEIQVGSQSRIGALYLKYEETIGETLRDFIIKGHP
jgi:hypothetical protein